LVASGRIVDEVKGGVLCRNECSGWENTLATSGLLSTGSSVRWGYNELIACEKRFQNTEKGNLSFVAW